MKTYKTVNEWIKSNPSKEQVEKVLAIVNRGTIHELRVEISEKEKYLRKLLKTEKAFAEIDMKVPKDLEEKIKGVTNEVTDLKKELPVVKKREKKEKVGN